MDLYQRLKKLLEQRANILKLAREIYEKCQSESRQAGAEEQANYDKAMADIAAVDKEVEQVRALLAEEQRQAELAAIESRDENRGSRPAAGNRDNEPIELEVRGQRWSYQPGTFQHAIGTDKFRQMFRSWLQTGRTPEGYDEVRALQVDNDTQAGYMVMPLQMQAGIVAKVDDMAKIRQYCTVLSVPDAKSLGVLTRENDPADPTWVAELSIGTADTTLDYGMRELTPHPAAQNILVSNTLLRRGSINVEAEIMDRLAHKLSVVQENGFMTGSGARQPVGLFNATASGAISTARDVSTSNTTTSITADNLITCLYTLKEQYIGRSRWLFHRDAIAQIAKLKDGNGNYLLRMVNNAQADTTLLGRPVVMSEYAPNTFTTGLYVGMIADFSLYYIADALTMSMQRLNELYAGTNQTGFLSRVETDAMPIHEEAFVRVTLA